jgi:FkbH-like protein
VANGEGKTEPKIKCVIWDLDNTLWDGVLLEDSRVELRPEIPEILKTLDERGILQSVSSKNDYQAALAKLEEFGIAAYFLYPQINWNPKSEAVRTIVQSLNIGMDTIAFIDDQVFEREEVKYALPEVRTIDAGEIPNLLAMPAMHPKFITEDSKLRRLMYQSDIRRNREEEAFNGPQEEFLAQLNMVFTIAPVTAGDLQRAEELTVRTHQLNTTGYTYSYEELDRLRQSDRHKLLIASLEDKFGTYGKIGLVLIECREAIWTIKLLLMSCRVMSRGVGSVLINYLMNLAKLHQVRLQAEFVPTDRNRMMYVTYKFAGFKEIEERENWVVFENSLERIQPFPDYIKLNAGEV